MSGLGDSAQLQYAATRPARRCSWRLQTGFAKGDQNKTVASVRVLENGCGDLEPGSGLVPEHGLVSRLTLVLSTCSIHDAMRDFKGLPGVVTGSRTLCQDVNHDSSSPCKQGRARFRFGGGAGHAVRKHQQQANCQVQPPPLAPPSLLPPVADRYERSVRFFGFWPASNS